MTWKLIVLVMALGGFSGNVNGQAAKAGSDWQHVRALPPGTSIEVRSTTVHVRCELTETTADNISCSHRKMSISFQQSEVQSIKITHRGRSALIGGAAVGGAAGIAGFAATTNRGDSFFGPNFLRGQVTALSIAMGAVVGGGVGALTDFSKSTVYKAP